ncbi:MAG: Phosphoglucosamine mutase [Methanomassiliicoccales archaeon PtaU1.Bin124]|nr:MAG: Phosphoglucosamine mutase [Methanomassiliicoccales archaeon PtaU1.Bin124]
MSIFGSSGIRGLVGSEFTVDLAVNIGKAVGNRYHRIIIGKDTRTSGDMVENALAAGAMALGAEVHFAGVVSTPTLARAAFDYDCGLMVTASHNPAEYNGVKMWNPDGSAFDTPQMEDIENNIGNPKLKLPTWRDVGTMHRFEGATQNHITSIMKSIGNAHLNVVVDCGCGATCGITPFLLREMGCSVFTINAQPDGHFPGRTPEPTEDALLDLRRIVMGKGADLGIAHDGDGDRMVAVDEKGRFVDGDKLLALFASLSEAGGIVAPIDASMVLDDIVDGNVVRTRVGDVYVAEALKKHNFPFGGEPSGTFIFPRETYCPDGVYAAALLCKFVSENHLSNLVDSLPSFPSTRESFMFNAQERDIVRGKIAAEMNLVKCQKLITVDGFRAEFEDGWFLIRLSGTEPKVRVTVEARSKDEVDRLMNIARSIVKRCLK